MLKVIAQRIAWTVPLLFIATALIFLMVHFAPGDAATVLAGGGEAGASPEQIAAIRTRLGLDRPVWEQYFQGVSGMLTGDLGTSLLSTRTVSDELTRRFPLTFALASGALFFSLAVGIPLGAVAAVKSDTMTDRFVTLLATFGIATPNFFLGLLLVLFVALPFEFFPTRGYIPLEQGVGEWLRHLILPSIALGASVAAEVARHVRASLRDVLQQDYIRTARSRGLSELKVIGKHGLKNAAIPVVTVLGLYVRGLLGGTVIIEAVFGIPGIGSLLVSAVFSRDLPMVQGVMLLLVILVVIANLLVDVSYSYFNPKVRAQ